MYLDLLDVEDKIGYCEIALATGDDGKPFYVFRFVEEPFDKIIFELYDMRLQDDVLYSSVRIHANPTNFEFSEECEFTKRINTLLEDILTNYVQSKKDRGKNEKN
jgi:hypothetical protein